MNNHKQIVEKYREQLNKALGREDWDIMIEDYKVSFSEKFEAGIYKLMVSDSQNHIAYFHLVPMINCCGILVSTRAAVADRFQKKGVGTILNSFRIDVARYLGYGVLMCTDVISNTPQQTILNRNGWKNIHSFINPRTKNHVGIHIINL